MSVKTLTNPSTKPMERIIRKHDSDYPFIYVLGTFLNIPIWYNQVTSTVTSLSELIKWKTMKI